MTTKTKETKPVTEFTIVRRRWGRGVRAKNSQLLNPETKLMCCLGFYLEACGFSRGELSGQSLPESVAWRGYEVEETKERLKRFRKAGAGWLVRGVKEPNDDRLHVSDTKLTMKLTETNDNKELSSEEIEVAISEIFAKKGIKVLFK